MIDPPTGIRGRAFSTVNNNPLTLIRRSRLLSESPRKAFCGSLETVLRADSPSCLANRDYFGRSRIEVRRYFQ